MLMVFHDLSKNDERDGGMALLTTSQTMGSGTGFDASGPSQEGGHESRHGWKQTMEIYI